MRILVVVDFIYHPYMNTFTLLQETKPKPYMVAHILFFTISKPHFNIQRSCLVLLEDPWNCNRHYLNFMGYGDHLKSHTNLDTMKSELYRVKNNMLIVIPIHVNLFGLASLLKLPCSTGSCLLKFISTLCPHNQLNSSDASNKSFNLMHTDHDPQFYNFLGKAINTLMQLED